MNTKTKAKKFDVTIKIQLGQTTSDVIEADNEEHAREIAEQNYWNDDYADELRNSSETDREDYYAQEVIEVMKCPVCEKVYEEFDNKYDEDEDRKTNTHFQHIKDYLGDTDKA